MAHSELVVAVVLVVLVVVAVLTLPGLGVQFGLGPSKLTMYALMVCKQL